nr:spore gernimation protein GerPD [Paenibacillus oenotherae]
MTAIASASMLQVGDSEQITLYSMFDTPPESVIVGPLVPLGIPEGEGESEVEAQTD